MEHFLLYLFIVFIGLHVLIFLTMLFEKYWPSKTVFKVEETIVCGKSSFQLFKITQYKYVPFNYIDWNYPEFNTLKETKEYIEDHKCKQEKETKIHKI